MYESQFFGKNPVRKQFVAGIAPGCFFFYTEINGQVSRHHKRRPLNDLIPNNETHTKHSWILVKTLSLFASCHDIIPTQHSSEVQL